MAKKTRTNLFTASVAELDSMISRGGKQMDKAIREKARRDKANR